ncbi:SusC/RagA family TonB-linked outer membrane protein [Halosquirtibacter xylanolyticus]|uniref:SusC/RagA family TonB-linked outer membrane protein n=1 Tax=Halosquirtibacter xylanolyticus TaxID=3374599 RepID=UPI00374A66AF|nr:SusC/RagA family TonB-linked outer membrane protein [Prolixibacteraceae bacterium]
MKRIIIWGVLSILSCHIKGQNKEITGAVFDGNTHEIMVGATVYNKNNNTGVVTDIQGRYKLKANIGDTIGVRFIGYREKFFLCEKSDNNKVILFPVTKILEETIVVAYGRRSKKKLNGAVTSINDNNLRTSVSNIGALLQGRVSGLQSITESGDPNAAPIMFLRGASSVHAYAGPLYVLNGLVVEASFIQKITPSNISSISILKDATATALYGSRGANGVIVIETKQAKTKGFHVGASVTYGLRYPNLLPVDLMSSKEKLQYEVLLGIKRLSEERIDELAANPTNWEKEVLRRGTSTELGVNIEGGKGKAAFRHQLSYRKDVGTLQNSSLDNFSFTSRLNHHLGDKITTSLFFYGNYLDAKNPTGIGDKLVKNSPVIQAYLNNPYDAPRDEKGNYISTSLGPNAIRDLEMINNETKTYHLRMQGNFKWDILAGFYFTGLYSWNYSHSLLDQFNPPGISMYQLDPSSSIQGDKKRSYSGNTRLQSSNQLHYKHHLSNHHIELMGAFETDYRKEDGFIALAKGYVSPLLSSLSSAEKPFQTAERYWERNMLSYISFIKYDWNNIIFFDGSFRRDGSSVFGKNNPYSNFYSLGSGLDLSGCVFNENVDLFKIRFSYGTSGNESISPYQTMKLYKFNQYYSGKKAGAAKQVGNKALGWEKSLSKSIGFDFLSKGSKYGISLDWYEQYTDDLLLDVQLSRLYGFSTKMMNAGAVRNRGFETSFTATPWTKGFWSLTFEAQYSYNDNEVTHTPNGEDIVNNFTIIREGEALGSVYLVPYGGVNVSNGSPIWVKKDGRLTETYDQSDAVVIGTGIPPHNGSFRVRLQNENLEIAVLFTGAAGNKVVNNNRYFFESDGEFMIYNQDRRLLTEAWEIPGDMTKIPKQVANGNNHQMSTRYVESGNYIKLKNVRIAYSIGRHDFGFLPFNTTLSVEATNLYTWTNYSGIDPEMARSVDAFRYPSNQSIFFGITMNF